jgi:hypothetical protein
MANGNSHSVTVVDLNTRFNNACTTFDMNIVDNTSSLVTTLDVIAKELAQSHEVRSVRTEHVQGKEN